MNVEPTHRGGCKDWCHSKGGVSDITLGKGGEGEKKEAVREVIMYISEKLQSSTNQSYDLMFVEINMPKTEIWRGGRAQVCLQLCTADDNIKY